MANEFLANVHLGYLEKTREYKTLVSALKKTLEAQSESVITSGIISKVIEERERIYNIVKAEGGLLSDNVAFLTFIIQLVKNKLQEFSTYKEVKDALTDGLLKFSNEGGQVILDSISDNTNTRPKVFKLTNEPWIGAIEERIDGLMDNLDVTTIETLSRQIAEQVKQNLSVGETIAALIISSKLLAERRAGAIAITEANAAYETMKIETAWRNGVLQKMWLTANDDRVCERCAPNNNEVVDMDSVFATGYAYPPAHPKCRCTIAYIISTSYVHMMEVGVTKEWVGSPVDFYQQHLSKEGRFTITNPNALWAGGDGLVGSDKKVGWYVQNIDYTSYVKELLKRSSTGELLLDILVESGEDLDDNIAVLAEARKTLTDVGFLQVITHLGFTGVLPTYRGRALPDYPVRNYGELEKRQAQDEVVALADANDTITLEDIGYPVYAVPEYDSILGEPQDIPVGLVRFSKKTLKAQRVVNIIDNFNEAQRRGGDGITVTYDEASQVYVVSGDGNHRLLAALMLGMKTIKASKVYLPRLEL